MIREAARVKHFKESESRNECYNAGTIKKKVHYSHVGSLKRPGGILKSD